MIQWNSSHPALRFVDAGLWQFAHCTILNAPSDATTLLETRKGPVAYAIEDGKKRRIVLGFALSDSSIPLLAGFPVFLQNALEWIQEGYHPVPASTTSEMHNREGFTGTAIDSPYVNFLDPSESNIRPQSPGGNSTGEIASLLRRQDVSVWFLILLVVVIIVEWWVFHQRIHVEA